jgi:capsid protein
MSTRTASRARAGRRPGAGAEAPAPPRRSRGALVGTRTRYTPQGPVVVSTWRGAGGGYHAVQVLRESGKPLPAEGSADAQLAYQLEDLRAASQLYDRDNGIYQATTTRIIDFILGEYGLRLQALTRSAKVNRWLERRWSRYMAAPEIRGMDDGVEFQRKWLRHLFVDGDVGLVKDAQTRQVQLIPGARIAFNQPRSRKGQRVEYGVELDKYDRPQRFHVAELDDWGNVRTTRGTWIEAADFIFRAVRLRLDQTRGVPIQQANFAMYERIQDVCDSEAAAWQLLSRMALAIETSDGAALGEKVGVAEGERDEGTLAKRVVDIGNAVIFYARPGEAVKGIDRNIPGANFVESLKMFLRLLGLPLGFSLEFMLLIWSDTNYSSGRASIKSVERNVRPWVRAVGGMLGDIYAWQQRMWLTPPPGDRLARKEARELQTLMDAKDIDPAELQRHRLVPQPYPLVDDDKGSKAQRTRLESGTTAPSLIAAENGDEHGELVSAQRRDIARCARAVERLRKQFPWLQVDVGDFTALVKSKVAAAKPAVAAAPAENDAQSAPDAEDRDDE